MIDLQKTTEQQPNTGLNNGKHPFFSHLQSLHTESVPFLMLIALIILIPTFFVTSPFVSFQFAKHLLLSIGITLMFAVFLIGIIKKGQFTFVKSPIFAGTLGLILAYIVSATFSSSFVKAFIGYGFELTTAGSIVLMSVLLFLVATIFNSTKKIFSGYLVFLSVTLGLGIFYLLRLWLGGDFPSFGIFIQPISNTIGKWSELAMFFGIGVILSTIALETLKLGKIYRVFLWLVLIASLLMVFIVNFAMVWYILAAVLILFFVYYSASSTLFASKMTISSTSTEEGTRLEAPRRRVAIKTLLVVIVTILCVLPVSRGVSQNLSVKLGIENIEIWPAWSSTQGILVETIRSSPIIGAGPNNFSKQWQLFRPDINESNFWNANFSHGVGFIPTSFVETGLLGIVAWLGFILSILYVGSKALFMRGVEGPTRYLAVSSFAVCLFLWVTNVVYMPSAAIFALAFFFTGLFVASSVSAGVVSVPVIPFAKYEKLSFAFVMVAVFFLIGSLSLGYVFFERGRSAVHFQKGVVMVNSGQDIVGGENSIVYALEVSENDVYYQNLATLNILKIKNLMAQVEGKTDVTEAQKNEFQVVLSRALQSALSAVTVDPENFENHAIVGRAYESIVPVKIEGAYQSSREEFERALALSPKNPGLYLDLARLEISNSNAAAAEVFISKSLALKPNFVEAIFLQSQIDVSRGDIPAAIRLVEKIAAISAVDPLAYFRLGILKYESKDYTGAIAALEKSIALSPAYANARYFLGLSYEKAGRRNDAVVQFEAIRVSNPGNSEVSSIISNIKSGLDPFYDPSAANITAETSAANNKIDIEDIEKLPVEEQY